MRTATAILAGLVGLAAAHGDHGGSKAPVVPADANWMTKHMAGKLPTAGVCTQHVFGI